MEKSEPLLRISGLRVGFPTSRHGYGDAVRGIDLSIDAGEAVGLVGESGSGKSVTAMAAMRLIAPPGKVLGGEVIYKGRNLLELSERDMRAVRGREISMIFQDPLTSLNPVFTIGQQLIDVIVTHQQADRRSARLQAIEALSLVGIPAAASRLSSYPHQLSGGMRQRVLIAMAIACRPQLLIADEPTTALDVTIQAQVMALLQRLRKDLGLAVLFITHNLDLIAELCDRVVVMYGGAVMEEAPVAALFEHSMHPYSGALMRCIPRLDNRSGSLSSIEGTPPTVESAVAGCSFQPRCSLRLDKCALERPVTQSFENHKVACWLVDEQ